jgi:hypothetical protein
MRVAFAIVCLALGIGQDSRPSDPVLRWMPVKKVCGRLTSERKGLVVSLPKTKITLYEAKWRTACCNGLKRVANRVTSDEGNFDFGNVVDGRYWLAVESAGKNANLPIDVDSRHDWDGACENQGLSIEKDFVSWVGGKSDL